VWEWLNERLAEEKQATRPEEIAVLENRHSAKRVDKVSYKQRGTF
jgi:hypothetical protein